MRPRPIVLLFALTLGAVPALASFDPASRPDPRPTSGGTPAATEQRTPRQQAEQWYHDAYEDVTKAKELQADSTADAKKVTKLYGRAIERADRALEFDKGYHEAWNLKGFAYRQLGQLDKSAESYVSCLGLKPDYAPAREYYGRTLLAQGDVEGAEAQLIWLRRLKAEDLARELEAAIAAAPRPPGEKAKGRPDTQPAAPSAAPAGKGN